MRQTGRHVGRRGRVGEAVHPTEPLAPDLWVAARPLPIVIRDRAATRRSVDRILAWDFDRVITSHGEVVESGGHALLERAFAFLPGR